MVIVLKFAFQTLVWFVALIVANNLLEKVWNKIKLVKPWNLKKA
jgi:hypothetical protein